MTPTSNTSDEAHTRTQFCGLNEMGTFISLGGKCLMIIYVQIIKITSYTAKTECIEIKS